MRLILFILLMSQLDSRPIEQDTRNIPGDWWRDVQYTKIEYGKGVTPNGDTISIYEHSRGW